MEKDLKKIIAAKYKYLRPDCAKIAAAMGITYQGVYYLLNGKNQMSLAKFIKLCQTSKLNPAKEIKEITNQLEAKDEKQTQSTK